MTTFQDYQKCARKKLKADKSNYHQLVGWAEIKHKHRFEYVTSIFPDVKTALDVGCGSGIYVDWMLKKGIDAKGIDFSPEQISNCRTIFHLSRKQVKVGNILFINEKDNSYDLVMSVGTHIIVGNSGPDLAERAINELVRVSKRYVLIDFGNAHWIFNFRYPSPTQKIWSRAYLAHICKKHNLRVVKERKFNMKSWLNAICNLPFQNFLHMDSVVLLEKGD